MRTLAQFIFLSSMALSSAAQAVDVMSPNETEPRPFAAKDTVYIEEMTWMEVRDALAAGKTTAIIATAGVEQTGPYSDAGSHGFIMRATTRAVARKVGNALVAPIVDYVPQGNIDPPSGHMRYPSTLSVSEATFMALLSDIANSLRVHGFENIVLIGDSGGNQNGMKSVAETLSKDWSGRKNKFGKQTRIFYINEYYDNERWDAWLAKKGYKEDEAKIHDRLRHTVLNMVVDPEHVRYSQRVANGKASINGISIENTEKMLALGYELLDYQADVTAKAIKERIAEKK